MTVNAFKIAALTIYRLKCTNPSFVKMKCRGRRCAGNRKHPSLARTGSAQLLSMEDAALNFVLTAGYHIPVVLVLMASACVRFACDVGCFSAHSLNWMTPFCVGTSLCVQLWMGFDVCAFLSALISFRFRVMGFVDAEPIRSQRQTVRYASMSVSNIYQRPSFSSHFARQTDCIVSTCIRTCV